LNLGLISVNHENQRPIKGLGHLMSKAMEHGCRGKGLNRKVKDDGTLINADAR
jgi:hypothetical protein